MPMKPCPRCKRMIPYGPSYCPACLPIVEAERAEAQERKREYRAKKYNREYNKRRDTTGEVARFRRSKPWKLTSKAKLDACKYRCEARLPGCAGLACEVHHIKPLKTPEGWNLRLDWSNLMGVCIQCHNILDNKTFNNKRKDEGVIDLRTVER